MDFYRRHRRVQEEALGSPLPPPARPPLLLPVRQLEHLFPGIESTSIEILTGQVQREPDMFLPLAESLIVSAICRHHQPKCIFELGTFTGLTTLQMAMNTSEATEIVTLDLKPGVSIGRSYRGTAAEKRIRPVYGDSRTFDFSPYYGTCDLVFIDANHTYEFAKSDTEQAFRLLSRGGIIIWDDYVWTERHPECAGVAKRLNELARHRPCYRIAETRLAVFSDGWNAGSMDALSSVPDRSP
jgi:predicted O-methyltransferase YrrM